MVGIVTSCREGPGLESRLVELLRCRSQVGLFRSTLMQIVEG